MMNQSALPDLSELRDIHLPITAPWWDIAIGWWLLLFLLVLLICGLWVLLPKMKRAAQARASKKEVQSAVFAELSLIRKAYDEQVDAHVLLVSISAFLRRVTLTFFEQNQTAGLIQDEWLNFLDAQWIGEQPDVMFTSVHIANLLNQRVYQPLQGEQNKAHITELLEITESWVAMVVKHHV